MTSSKTWKSENRLLQSTDQRPDHHKTDNPNLMMIPSRNHHSQPIYDIIKAMKIRKPSIAIYWSPHQRPEQQNTIIWNLEMKWAFSRNRQNIALSINNQSEPTSDVINFQGKIHFGRKSEILKKKFASWPENKMTTWKWIYYSNYKKKICKDLKVLRKLVKI